METKSFKINIPEGFEIDKEKSTFEEIVFKPIKKELPKKWEDLHTVQGYCVDFNTEIKSSKPDFLVGGMYKTSRNVFPTLKEAEASIALAQLCQLRDIYNEGWKPNWVDIKQNKYVIGFEYNPELEIEDIYMTQNNIVRNVITLKSIELAKQFLENFKDLIEQAKPLL